MPDKTDKKGVESLINRILYNDGTYHNGLKFMFWNGEFTNELFTVESTFTVRSCICLVSSSLLLLFVQSEYIIINAYITIDGTI